MGRGLGEMQRRLLELLWADGDEDQDPDVLINDLTTWYSERYEMTEWTKRQINRALAAMEERGLVEKELVVDRAYWPPMFCFWRLTEEGKKEALRDS